MDYHSAKAYLLSKPNAVEDYPFGPEVMVPKIKGKMFATLSINPPNRSIDVTNDMAASAMPAHALAHMNLKCDPNHAFELRDLFDAVKPGYHMNKQHWNTVILDGSIPDGEIERMIDHSYALVVKKLKKSDRAALEILHGQDALYKE